MNPVVWLIGILAVIGGAPALKRVDDWLHARAAIHRRLAL